MAIRTNQMPQYGRITRPVGTYLSNPSTAADGALGGAQGMNPATGWTGSLGYGVTPPSTGMWWTPQNPNPVVPKGQWYSGIVSGLNNLNRNVELYVNEPLKKINIGPVNLGPLTPFASQMAQVMQPSQTPTGIFDAAAQASSGEQIQGYRPGGYGGISTNAVTNADLMNAISASGKDPNQVVADMVRAGYTQKYQPGVGMVWYAPAEKTPTVNGGAQPVSSNGRQEWVDGASLAPGQEAYDMNGNRYVGGTPAPDGTPQYALNFANPNAARDTKGRYKWVSRVQRDQNGNWVRINQQVLRKVYTRSHLKKAAARREQQQQAESSGGGAGQNYNQLVNFRVNYG